MYMLHLSFRLIHTPCAGGVHNSVFQLIGVMYHNFCVVFFQLFHVFLLITIRVTFRINTSKLENENKLAGCGLVLFSHFRIGFNDILDTTSYLCSTEANSCLSFSLFAVSSVNRPFSSNCESS